MNENILADAYFQRIISAILADKQDEARAIHQEMGHYFSAHPKYKAFAALENTSTRAQGNVHFLGVGINDYQPPFRPLSGCVNDVMLIKETLSNIWKEQLHSIILLDKHATAFSVKAALKDLAEVATPADSLVFYFSGHAGKEIVDFHFNTAGISDYFMAMSDTVKVAEGVLPKAILGEDLFECMKQSEAHNKFVIIDSHADEAFIARVEKEGNFSIIFGCSPGEQAMESMNKGVRNGVLTRYLCEVVENQRRQTVDRFFLYTKLCEEIKVGFSQTPYMVGDIAGLFFPEVNTALDNLVKITCNDRSLTEAEFYTMQGVAQQESTWFWPILKKMGAYLLERGQWERASLYLEEYLRFDRSLETTLVLTEAYDRQGDYERSKDCIQQWVKQTVGLEEEHPARLLLKKYESLNEAKQQQYALLVGISQYEALPALLSAHKDAEHWYEYLTKDLNIPPENITLLVDHNATRENLLKEIQKHCTLSAKHPVLFSFSGYGTAYDANNLIADNHHKALDFSDSFDRIEDYNVIPAILSFDARKDGIQDILFTEIQEIYEENSGKNLSCIFDMGGNGTRGKRGIIPMEVPTPVQKGGLDMDERRSIPVPIQQCGAVTMLQAMWQGSRTQKRRTMELCKETPEGGQFTMELLKAIKDQGDKPFSFLQKRLSAQALAPILLGHDTVRLLRHHRFARQEIQAINDSVWGKLKESLQKIAGSRFEADFPDCQVNIAIAEALLNNVDKAISMLTSAAAETKKEKTRNVLASYHLGRLLVLNSAPNDSAKWSQAATSLRTASEKYPNIMPIYYYLGRAIQQVTLIEGRSKAAEAFQKYEEAGYPIGFKNEVTTFLDALDEKRFIKRKVEDGQRFISERNFIDAERSFEEAKTAGSLEADYHLGRVLEEQKDPLQALNAYVQARDNKVPQVDLPHKIAKQFNELWQKTEIQKRILDDLKKYHAELSTPSNEKELSALIEALENIRKAVVVNPEIQAKDFGTR